MVPHTRDGRVMFAIPWHGHTRGRDDRHADRGAARSNRVPQETEIEFVLETAALYLHKAPTRADVLSVFAGIRPLVRTGDSRITAALSRDHTIHIDPSGLLTTAGGKWTTYRHMAEDTVDQAIEFGAPAERTCVTRESAHPRIPAAGRRPGRSELYGADAARSVELEAADPSLAAPLDPAPAVHRVAGGLGRARGIGADGRGRSGPPLPRVVPQRRGRVRMAPAVAALMAKELGRDDAWQRAQVAAFETLAGGICSRRAERRARDQLTGVWLAVGIRDSGLGIRDYGLVASAFRRKANACSFRLQAEGRPACERGFRLQAEDLAPCPLQPRNRQAAVDVDDGAGRVRHVAAHQRGDDPADVLGQAPAPFGDEAVGDARDRRPRARRAVMSVAMMPGRTS